MECVKDRCKSKDFVCLCRVGIFQQPAIYGPKERDGDGDGDGDGSELCLYNRL